jgi:hypothetical protein
MLTCAVSRTSQHTHLLSQQRSSCNNSNVELQVLSDVLEQLMSEYGEGPGHVNDALLTRYKRETRNSMRARGLRAPGAGGCSDRRMLHCRIAWTLACRCCSCWGRAQHNGIAASRVVVDEQQHSAVRRASSNRWCHCGHCFPPRTVSAVPAASLHHSPLLHLPPHALLPLLLLSVLVLSARCCR